MIFDPIIYCICIEFFFAYGPTQENSSVTYVRRLLCVQRWPYMSTQKLCPYAAERIHKSRTFVLTADHAPISLVRLKLPYMGCTRAPGDSPYDTDPTYIAFFGHCVLVWVLVWVSGHLHPTGHTRGRIKQTTKQTTIYGRYGWLRGKKLFNLKVTQRENSREN